MRSVRIDYSDGDEVGVQVLDLSLGQKGTLYFLPDGEKVEGAVGRLIEMADQLANVVPDDSVGWRQLWQRWQGKQFLVEAIAAARLELAQAREGERVVELWVDTGRWFFGKRGGSWIELTSNLGMQDLLGTPGTLGLRRLPDESKKAIFWRRPGAANWTDGNMFCGRCGAMIPLGIDLPMCPHCGAVGEPRDIPEAEA